MVGGGWAEGIPSYTIYHQNSLLLMCCEHSLNYRLWKMRREHPYMSL